MFDGPPAAPDFPTATAVAGELAGIDKDQLVVALRRFIHFDVSCSVAGVAFIAAVYVLVANATSLAILGLVILAAAVLMASGLWPLRHRDLDSAVGRVSVANWAVTLVAAIVAGFAWPVLAAATLIPAILATPYVSSRRLRAYVAISLLNSTAIVVVGLLPDMTALSATIPQSLQNAALIVFLPLIGAMIALLARQNNELTRAILHKVVEANEQLRTSQQSLHRQTEALRRSRARVVAATDRERRRIEQNIHDGAQQHLVGIDIQLATAQGLAGGEQPPIEELLATTRAMVQAAHADLRALAHGIFPPILTEQGLPAALDSAADQSPIPVSSSIADVPRQPPDVEAAVYFCCLEALQNSAKHAGPTASVLLSLTERDGRLFFDVSDTGPGIPTIGSTEGNGHANIEDRIGAVGGQVTIEANQPRGTRVSGWVPFHPGPTAIGR